MIAKGGRVTVHAKNAPGKAFPLTVSRFAPDRRISWADSLPLGLVAGTRHFILTPLTGGNVRFTMAASYSGLVAPLIRWSIPDLQPSFDAFAADLKRRPEA